MTSRSDSTPSRRKSRTKPKAALLTQAAEWAATQSWQFCEEGSPLPVPHYVPGRVERLLVITGDNASGKSVMASVVGAAFRDRAMRGGKQKVEVVPVTMRARTDDGGARLFLFSGDGYFATGAVSVGAAVKGLDRLGDHPGSLVVLDEPEVGLAPGYAYAMGSLIADRVGSLPAGDGGVVLVSHSRELVRGVVEGLGEAGEPSFIHLGAPTTITEWITTTPTKTIEDLLALPDNNLDLFRALTAHNQRATQKDT